MTTPEYRPVANFPPLGARQAGDVVIAERGNESGRMEITAIIAGLLAQVATSAEFSGDGTAGSPLTVASIAYSKITGAPNVFRARGAFARNTAYEAGDVVIFNHHLYYVAVAVPADNTKDPVDGDTWVLLSADPVPAQVQTDWAETDSASAAFLRNKPTVPTGALAAKDEVASTDLDADTPAKKTAFRAAIGAGTSDFDGAYASLTGKPSIPVDTTIFKGAFATLTAYPAGSIVTHAGDVFLALVAIPDTNTAVPVQGSSWEQLDVGAPGTSFRWRCPARR